MTLLVISFIAGILTVLAPCILPLLPVIVGGSISPQGEEQSNKKRALTVTAALAVSVILFTLLLKATTTLIAIPDYVWKWVSGGLIIVIGLIILFPKIWEKVKFTARINRASNQVLAQGYQRNSFWGDVVIGAALGPVFSTCSPTYFIVLATVLPERPIIGFIYLLAYVVGLSLTLLLIALVGQRIINKLGFVADDNGWFKRTLGALFIIVGIGILLGIDKQIQTKVLDSGFLDITRFENRILERANISNK